MKRRSGEWMAGEEEERVLPLAGIWRVPHPSSGFWDHPRFSRVMYCKRCSCCHSKACSVVALESSRGIPEALVGRCRHPRWQSNKPHRELNHPLALWRATKKAGKQKTKASNGERARQRTWWIAGGRGEMRLGIEQGSQSASWDGNVGTGGGHWQIWHAAVQIR